MFTLPWIKDAGGVHTCWGYKELTLTSAPVLKITLLFFLFFLFFQRLGQSCTNPHTFSLAQMFFQPPAPPLSLLSRSGRTLEMIWLHLWKPHVSGSKGFLHVGFHFGATTTWNRITACPNNKVRASTVQTERESFSEVTQEKSTLQTERFVQVLIDGSAGEKASVTNWWMQSDPWKENFNDPFRGRHSGSFSTQKPILGTFSPPTPTFTFNYSNLKRRELMSLASWWEAVVCVD